MKFQFKRVLSFVLAIVMVIGMMPTNIVFAEENDIPGSDVVEETTAAPVEETTEASVEETTEAPVEETTEAPVEETTEAPVEETTEAPVEETTEAPTEEETEAPKAELSGETRKIYYYNVESWDEVWAAWSFDEEDFEDVAHPGEEMDDETDLENVWVIRVPVEADEVLFSDGIEVTEELLEQERLAGISVTHEIEVRLAGDKFYNLYQNEAWANYAKTVEALNATEETEAPTEEETEAPTEDPAVAEVQAMIDALPTQFATQAEVDAFWDVTAANLDAAIEALTPEQQEQLDTARYDEAIDAAASFANPEFDDWTTWGASNPTWDATATNPYIINVAYGEADAITKRQLYDLIDKNWDCVYSTSHAYGGFKYDDTILRDTALDISGADDSAGLVAGTTYTFYRATEITKSGGFISVANGQIWTQIGTFKVVEASEVKTVTVTNSTVNVNYNMGKDTAAQWSDFRTAIINAVGEIKVNDTVVTSDIVVKFHHQHAQSMEHWVAVDEYLELNAANASEYDDTEDKAKFTIGYGTATPATITVTLIDSRPAPNTYTATAESKNGISGIQSAAATAAAELGLAVADFTVPSDWETVMAGKSAGETAVFAVTATYAGGEVYKPGTVTVNVTVTKSAKLPAVVTVTENEDHGDVIITDKSGNTVNSGDKVGTDLNPLTVTVTPHKGNGYAYYIDSITVNGAAAAVTYGDNGIATANFSVTNSSETENDPFAVHVTYGLKQLHVNTSSESAPIGIGYNFGQNASAQLSAVQAAIFAGVVDSGKMPADMVFGNLTYEFYAVGKLSGNYNGNAWALTNDETGYNYFGERGTGCIEKIKLIWPASADKKLPAVSMDAFIQLNESRTYTVTWSVNGNNTTETYTHGDTPSFKGSTDVATDAYFSYEFTGWDKEIVAATGDVTYTAQYEKTRVQYKVTWIVDGVTTEEWVDNGAAIEAPDAPSKEGYDFLNWAGYTEGMTMPTEDKTFTANFAIKTYTITWDAGDGVFSNGEKTITTEVDHGQVPAVPSEQPSKASDDLKNYTFGGWGTLVAAKEDKAYVATYTDSAIMHTVTWYDEDGETVRYTGSFAAGSAPAYAGAMTTAAMADAKDTAEYDYSFESWIPGNGVTDGKITADNAVFTAKYSKIKKSYPITFKNENGNVLQSGNVSYGEMPVFVGNTAVLADAKDTVELNYSFAGWNPVIEAVTGPADYVATYSSVKQEYTVTFKNWNNDVIWSGAVEYGVKPTAPTANAPANHAFAGWDKEVVAVTGEATYTATYTLVASNGTVYVNGSLSEGAKLNNLKNKVLTAAGLPTNGNYTVYMTVGKILSEGTDEINVETTDGISIARMYARFNVGDSQGFVITNNDTGISASVTMKVADARLILNVEISGNVEIVAKSEPADVMQQIKNKITITATNPQTNETTNVTAADDYISFEPAYAWPADAQTAAFKVTVSVAPLGNETYQAYAAKELTLTCTDTTILNEIVWDTNGGKWEEGTTKTDKVPEGTVPTEPAAPTREYYTFAGWTPTIEKTPVGDETYTKTYKANWNAVLDNNQNNVADQEELYTVIYRDGYQDGEAGVYATYADQVWDSETPIPGSPVRDGYYFKDWDINPEGVKIAAPAVKDSTTITYTAIWSLKCNVTFDGVATEYEAGTMVNAPAAPEKDQYLFQGWALKGDENQTIVTFPYKVTDSVDFVSIWAADRNRDGDIDGTAADPFSYYVWVDTNGNELNKVDWLDGETAITANSYAYAETANDSKVFDGWTEKTVGDTTTYTLALADDANNNEVKDSDETITVAAGEGKVEINGAAVANGDYVFDSKNTHTIVVTPPAQHYIASISFAARAVTGTYANSVLTIENYTLVDGTTLEVSYAEHEILADGNLTVDVNGYSSSTIFADITKEAVLEAILGTHYDAAKVNEYTLEMKIGTASIKDKLGALGSGLPDVIDVNIFDLKSLSEKYGSTIASVVESVIRGSFDLNETETFKLTWDSSDETKPVISGEYVVSLKDDRPYANAWLKEGKGSYNSSTIDDALLALIQEDLETDSNIIGLSWETVPETVDEGKTYELVVIVKVGGTEELQAKDDIKIPVTVTTPVIKASIVIPESAVMIYNTSMTDAKLNEMVVKALNDTVPGIVYTPEELKEHDVTVCYLARAEGTVPVRIQYTGLSGLINIDETIDVPVKALWLNIGEAFPDVGEEPSQADLDKLVEDMIDIYGMELLDMSEAELKNVFLNNIDKYPELKKYITYIGTHEFGYNTEKDSNGAVVETVKLQQADFGYGILETNISKISLNDQRYETYIVLNEGVSLTYGFSETALLDALGAKVYAKTENGDVLVSNTVALVTNIEGMGVSENAEITVKYAGDADNQYCTATTTIAITKAPVKVSVDNQVVKYGQSINMLPVSTDPAGVATIQLIVGLNVNNVNLEDIKVQGLMAQAQLLLPDELQDLLVMAGDAISAATGLNLSFADGASMKLSELQAATGALKDVFKDSQYAEYFNILLNMLDSLPTEVADIEIIIGGTLPTDIGAYLIGAVTADANYENVPGVGVLVISPDGTRAELDWYQDDENYIITQTLLTTKGADGRYLFDTSAKVTSVSAGGSIEAAEAQVVEIFLGVNIDGEITLTTDQTALNVGAYGEIALIADWGNTMYYAVPIARPIVVVAESLNVDFLDENGNVNNVRLVEFDNTVKDLLEGKLLVTYKQNGKGYQAGDELTEYDVKYLYTGVQTNGVPYAKTTAPAHAGAYAVTAIVTVRNGSTITHAGVGHAVLTIEPTTSNISVGNKVVVYDGNAYGMSDKIVATSKVAGLTPDTTIISAGLSANLDQINGLKDITGNVNVDMPAWLDEVIKKLGILDAGYADGITASTFLNYVDKINAALAEQGIEIDAFDKIVNIVNQLPVNTLLTFHDDIKYTNVGTYLFLGVVTDSDHYPSVGAGVLAITPDGTKVQLRFEEDWNGNNIFTWAALEKMNLEAKAYDLGGNENAAATAKVVNLYFGFTDNGEFLLASVAHGDSLESRSDFDNGVYTQMALLLDLGNEMYYAEPITRAFVIVPNAATVEFVDENGNVNTDRHFIFNNQPHGMDVRVTVNGKEVTDLTGLTVTYVGVQTNGEFYNSTVAPIHSGAYTVAAAYTVHDELDRLVTLGVSVGAMVIEPAQSTIDVQSKLHEYDGNPVATDALVKTGSAVAGITPDKTVITTSISTDGTFSENLLNSITSEVNVDFPAWVDKILTKYAPSIYNGMKAGEFTNKVMTKLNDVAADAKALAEEYNIPADKLINAMDNALTEVEEVVAQLPEDVVLTFKDQTEVAPSAVGTYLIIGIVTDSDHYPSADVGVLVIYPKVTEAKLEWVYKDSNGIFTLPALKNIDLGAMGIVNGAEDETVTDMINYLTVGIDEHGKLIATNQPDSLTSNGAYTEVAYIPVEIGAEMTVAAPIIRSFLVVPQTVTVEVTDTVATYGKDYEVPVAVMDMDGKVITGDRLKNLKLTYIGVNAADGLYNSTAKPANSGIYTVVATYIEKEGNEYAYVGMNVGTLTVVPASATVDVKNRIHEYNGEKFDVMDLITSNPDDAKLAIITAALNLDGDFSEDGILATGTSVNIDFPARADEVIREVLPQAYAEGIALNPFFQKLDDISAKLVEVGFDAAEVETLKNHLAQLPSNTKLTFKEQSEINPSNIGVYLINAVVMDPDYIPAFDAGLLVITADADLATLKWNYRDSNNIITREVIAKMDMAASAYTDGSLEPNAALTDRISYVVMGVGSNGSVTLIDDPAQIKNLPNGVYTEVAYIYQQIDAEMNVVIPIIRTFVIVNHSMDVDFEDIVVPYDGQRHPVEVTINDNPVEKRENLTVHYINLGRGYYSTMAPDQIGSYTVIAKYEEIINGDIVAYGMEIGNVTITPANSEINVTGDTVTYDGKEHSATVTVTGGTGDADYLLISGGAYVKKDLTEINVDAFYGNVNIDFPAWLDKALDEYEFKKEGIDAAYLIDFIDSHRNNLVAMGLFHEKIDAAINELLSILDRMPKNVSLTFNDDVTYCEPGYYFYYGIVMDPNHYPSSDTGLLIIEKKDMLFDLLDTTATWNGKGQMVDTNNPQNADFTTLIIDRKNNTINILLDEDAQYVLNALAKILDVEFDGDVQMSTIIEKYSGKEIADAIVKLIGQLEKLELVNEIQNVLTAVKNELETLPANGTVTVNAPLPSEIGEYEFYAISYSQYFKTVASEATLEIVPVQVEVILDNVSKTYGEEDPELTYTVKYYDHEGNEVTGIDAQITVEISREEGEDVGTYVITGIVTLGETTHFELIKQPEPSTFEIKKDESNGWTEEPGIEDWIYGEEPNEPTGEAKYGEIKVEYRPANDPDAPFTETVPTDAGDYVVRFTVEGTDNYNGISVEKELTIEKADSKITADPAAVEALVYNGNDQALVSGGTAEGGKLVYSLSENGPFTEEIPVGKDAGEYTVYYKVAGDDNHKDSEVKSMEVTIAKATPEVEAPTGLIATTGQTLADVTLPEGFIWEDDNTTSVGNVGENEFWVVYTPEDTDNYESVRIKVTVTVSNSNEGKYPIPFNPNKDETGTIVPGSTVDIDGTPVVLDENGIAWVDNTDAKIVTTYKYHEGTTVNETYPTNMYVWYLQMVDKDGDGEMDEYSAERIPELDNYFQYNGTSIRVGAAKNGIRFFTSIEPGARTSLQNGTLINTSVLKGAKMVRAGTVFKKNPEVPVTLENGVSSDVYGGKAGSSFRVFSTVKSRDWFTGMLVGLDTDAATINAGIAARPYAELQIGDETVVIYGGQIQRSIYYVATQNQNTFAQGSAYDNFVEGLIAKGKAGK